MQAAECFAAAQEHLDVATRDSDLADSVCQADSRYPSWLRADDVAEFPPPTQDGLFQKVLGNLRGFAATCKRLPSLLFGLSIPFLPMLSAK